MSFNNVLTELLTIAELGQNQQLRDVADRLHDAHNHELAEVKKAARHDKLLAEAFKMSIAYHTNANNKAKDSEYVKATFTKAEVVAELNTQLGQIISNVHAAVMRAENMSIHAHVLTDEQAQLLEGSDGSCLDHPDEPNYCKATCAIRDIWREVRRGK